MAACMNCGKEIHSGYVLCVDCAGKYCRCPVDPSADRMLLSETSSESSKKDRVPVANKHSKFFERLYIFADFLNNLALQLSDSDGKCAICKEKTTCSKEGITFCYQNIKESLWEKVSCFSEELEKSCDIYCEYLDQLDNQGCYTMLTAEEALVEEFPYLSDHREYAKYAMAIWIARHGA